MVGDTLLICRATLGKLLTMISYLGWSAAVNERAFFITVGFCSVVPLACLRDRVIYGGRHSMHGYTDSTSHVMKLLLSIFICLYNFPSCHSDGMHSPYTLASSTFFASSGFRDLQFPVFALISPLTFVSPTVFSSPVSFRSFRSRQLPNIDLFLSSFLHLHESGDDRRLALRASMMAMICGMIYDI